ncbi:MAG: ATP-grasp domain-containing protein [Propionibacteriaceae bacterium]|jgi:biotin carboxylase|nr:ATP-grasp domain-containing protein [Propionibacteriaceae bacterium]
MPVIALEWLTYGLGRLADAATERGVNVTLLTGDASAYRHELADRKRVSDINIVKIDTSNDEAIASYLRNLPDLEGLISTTDTWSLTALGLCQKFGLASQNSAGVSIARDKVKLRSRLFEHGLSVANGIELDPTAVTRGDLASIPFPFIVKDSAGTGSRNVWTVLVVQDIDATIDELHGAAFRGALAVEPYFCGPLYSAETISYAGETRVLGVNSRIMPPPPSFREDGCAFPIQFPDRHYDSLCRWITEVLQAVELTDGFAHTEFIVTRDGFEVVEVNPRLGGGLIGETICRSLSVNIFEAFIDFALGNRPRLMDAPLAVHDAYAEIVLYAAETGIFRGIDGSELLPLHPGAPELYQAREIGAPIVSINDH